MDVIGLWEDGQSGKHFLGPLVCTVEKAIPGQPTVYLLIDGQQRLTTLTLLLAVLRDKAMEMGTQIWVQRSKKAI